MDYEMESVMVDQKGAENRGGNLPVMSKEEVAEYLEEIFPQVNGYNLKIEEISAGKAVVTMKTEKAHLRPGNTVSGPTIFTLADLAFYVLILAHIGKVALTVTTNININFLNKPKAGTLTAHTSFLKRGKRLIVCDVQIFSDEILIAHATGTYSVPAEKMK